MCKFLTDEPRIQHYKDDKWISFDNVLFKDKDNCIYLVPRNFVTDLYSIPNLLAWTVGDSAGRDPRPALLHDFGCAYHNVIRVYLNEAELLAKGYLTKYYSKSRNRTFTICENIPKEYLDLIPVTKGSINDMFGRMLKCLDIDKRREIRFGVCFNFNYYKSGKDYNWNNLYKEDNHYEDK